MGRLRLVVLAAAALVAAPSLAGQRMSESELAKTFRGLTLNAFYRNGDPFRETYATDGHIDYRDETGKHRGHWTVRSGMFCTIYQGLEGACFFVERDGRNCFVFYEPKDPTAAQPEPQFDWSARGWNPTSRSTCPTGAEVEI